MIKAKDIFPSVGQTFHDSFRPYDSTSFLDKTQEEAQGLAPRPRPITFRESQNGIDQLGSLRENGISMAPVAKLPQEKSIQPENSSTVKPDTWKGNTAKTTQPTDILTDAENVAESVKTDLAQVVTQSTISMSRRNFFLIIALVVLSMLLIIAILKK